jgi:hypothetical protein
MDFENSWDDGNSSQRISLGCRESQVRRSELSGE